MVLTSRERAAAEAADGSIGPGAIGVGVHVDAEDATAPALRTQQRALRWVDILVKRAPPPGPPSAGRAREVRAVNAFSRAQAQGRVKAPAGV